MQQNELPQRMEMENTIHSFKKILKGVPGVGPLLVRLHGRGWSSSDYWDRRYRSGGNSGAGSYNRLAAFKAAYLNDFVAMHQIESVIEFGSGDGSQLKLARYPIYTGVDISATAVDICRSAFSGDPSKQFVQSSAFMPGMYADLTLSLDVVFHLVEDDVFEAYMKRLFASALRFVIVYSSNTDGEGPSRHVRHRRFTRWIEQNEPQWYLQATVKNLYPYDASDADNTSFADFHVFTLHTTSSAESSGRLMRELR